MIAAPKTAIANHEAVTTLGDRMMVPTYETWGVRKVLMAFSGRAGLPNAVNYDFSSYGRCDLAKVARCVCTHLRPNAGTKRASGFGLFSKRPVESAAQRGTGAEK